MILSRLSLLTAALAAATSVNAFSVLQPQHVVMSAPTATKFMAASAATSNSLVVMAMSDVTEETTASDDVVTEAATPEAAAAVVAEPERFTLFVGNVPWGTFFVVFAANIVFVGTYVLETVFTFELTPNSISLFPVYV